ncbi:MCE family protein [bacterium]|nr:MCE family protein [bacterium]
MKNMKSVYVFTFSAMLFFFALVGGAAWRQGWFMPRDTFHVIFEDAGGISEGTTVFLMGLKVGDVDSVELTEDGKIEVKLEVLRRYSEKLHADTTASAERAFVIGERVIKLDPGTPSLGPLTPGSTLTGHKTMEIVDLLSGGRMSAYFETFHLLMEQMKLLVDAAGGDNGNITDLYKQMYQTLKSVEELSMDVRSIRKEVLVTKDSKKLLSNMANASSDLQRTLAQMNTLLPHLNDMSGEMRQAMPDLVNAVKESVITLQAMQKSYFLRSGVEEIKEERSKADRKTASEKD